MSNHRIEKYTGLCSRAYALAVLEDLINHADEGEQIGVIFIDIDFFKRFNDRRGHNLGDKMLWALARMMENVIGRDGAIARYGGDEFLIVMQETTLVLALQKAEMIRESALNVTVESNGKPLEPLTLTVAVSCFPDDGETATKLLEEADLAVITGKNNGRNRVLSARNPLWRDAPPY